MKISFIGFGNMAKALAQGLLGDETNELRAASPSLPIGVNEQGIRTFSDNLAIVSDADIIILAVKPAQMTTVLSEISTQLPAHCLLISIVTGISLSWFATFSQAIAVVRAMPNIAAATGLSATPLIANKFATADQRQWAEQLFARIGIITWVKNEAEINRFTALSGSGPAYVFLLMEAMIKAATDLGMTEDIAKSFTLQTFKGAVRLACKSKLSLAELRNTVTSPAGTTAAAIEVLTKHGFDQLIHAAMLAACDRARQLGAQAQ